MRGIIVATAITATLALPSLASAHTGSVACTTDGVTFTYQANFAHDTVVTEIVKPANGDGIVRTFNVPAHTAMSDSIPAPATAITASASWRDGTAPGSIGPVDLTGCTQAPPPVCIGEVVTRTVYTPGPETVQYVPYAVAGETVTKVVTKIKVVYRTRIKWRTRIKLIRYHEPKQLRRLVHKQPGVTG